MSFIQELIAEHGYAYPLYPQDQKLGEIMWNIDLLQGLVFKCTRGKSTILRILEGWEETKKRHIQGKKIVTGLSKSLWKKKNQTLEDVCDVFGMKD